MILHVTSSAELPDGGTSITLAVPPGAAAPGGTAWWVASPDVVQDWADQLRLVVVGAAHDYRYPIERIADEIAPAIEVEPEPEPTVTIEIPRSLAEASPTDLAAMRRLHDIAEAALASDPVVEGEGP